MKLVFTIDKIEGERAALNDGGGKIISWPINKLPADAKVDDKITFNIGEDDDLAKDILNEILEN
ncbi:MAG TPA: hypothetical protein VMC41_01720 [Candidatus Nanoarchaeia archaeon]|nr:hypothetical protein [Candidatus Nanoarchaeia archaeon]